MPSIKKVAAAETYPPSSPPPPPVVVVRKYKEESDKAAVEELERRCEVGQPGKPSLVTDLMGDPAARVRNFTRLGIGTKLVRELEKWCKRNGAEYAYMATEYNNQPSLNLFTKKCNYVKFRNPSVLVQPVHLHSKPLSSDVMIVRIPPQLVELVYRDIFANSEFFPKDIDCLLSNKLSLGTFMALPKKSLSKWNPKTDKLPSSFAILSVWDTKEVYRLQVKGVSVITHIACLGTRVLDAMVPWLKIPSFPNVFENFGYYFLYGLYMQGREGSRLMRNLCKFAYNMARADVGCRVVVAEVGQMDPVREAIPHWKKFSWDEDVWCIKPLFGQVKENNYHEWYRSSVSSSVIFVDPRDI
ncbi:Probable N-acetyltransferase HLS1-like [Striga hermonthica]|uniref:Probable N-acetyltransferase HLS1-like n=1 Tax=Striga hermonthica TaxID=68872 RepID=A0A9N7R8Q2_STRHE|nr:Probable N-acetyltransferase HLS1-like [Striga hermonthica]